MYWKEEDGMWGRDGCSLITDNIIIICQCNHLTNFTLGRSATLPAASTVVQEPGPTKEESFNKLLIIIPVAVVVAAILLVLIILLVITRKLRQRRVRPS